MEQMRERVARAIAPFLEGGREFDKMPVNRLQLREWARQAMCGFNDATQDDAYEAADALTTLFARVETLEAENSRLRGPVTTYKHGFGPSDGESAIAGDTNHG